MEPFTPQKHLLYDVSAIITTMVAVFITYFSLSRGIYEVFPFFYLVPLVLIAFSRPSLGIYGTLVLGWIYLVLVYLIGLPDAQMYTRATIWFYIFVSLGILISTYSRSYRREGEKSCGMYYNSQAGVFSYDKKTLALMTVNQKLASMLKYDREELMKKTIPDILPDQKERDNFFSEIQDRQRIRDIEVRLLAADGSLRWGLVSAVDCDTSVIICTVVDITDHERAQEALTNANRKLNLLNNVTRHDILNQLTALTGYLELSRQEAPNPVMLSYIEKEEKAARAIKRQILFTRDYQNIGVNLPGWHNVGETASLAIATLDLAKVKVTIDLPHIEIYADPLLEKVFYNLVENSVRHGEHVTKVSIRSAETPDGLDIIVEDDGIGIPEKEKENIFIREYYRHTGFGMFLSREILAITNLSIRETGTPGQGARFIIHAPTGTFRMAPLAVPDPMN
jgi:PAS domain S-box-containing protein